MKLALRRVTSKRKRGRHVSKRKHWWHHTREYLWPTMGFLSFLRLTKLQIKRQKDAAHKVALGLAFGFLMGVQPMFGQIIVAVFLAWVFRANIVMAILGTFIGVPWTFPFIFFWEYNLGNRILMVESPPPFPGVKEFFNVEYLADVWYTVHLPIFVGAIPTGIILALIVYVVTYFNIDAYHKLREVRRKKKWAYWKEILKKHAIIGKKK